MSQTDERPLSDKPWRTWQIVLAYAIMFAVAMVSIWTIDRHVMKVSADAARAEGL